MTELDNRFIILIYLLFLQLEWKQNFSKSGGGEKYEGRMEERKSVTSGGNSMDKGWKGVEPQTRHSSRCCSWWLPLVDTELFESRNYVFIFVCPWGLSREPDLCKPLPALTRGVITSQYLGSVEQLILGLCVLKGSTPTLSLKPEREGEGAAQAVPMGSSTET